MSHGSTFDKKDPANDFTMTTNSKGILSVGPDESHLQSATIAIALKLDNVKKVFEPRSASAKKMVVKALDGVSFEVRRRRVCLNSWPIRKRQIHTLKRDRGS